MILRGLVVFSTALIIVHGSESDGASKVTSLSGNTPKVTSGSEFYSASDSDESDAFKSTDESASMAGSDAKTTPEVGATGTGSDLKSTAVSGKSASITGSDAEATPETGAPSTGDDFKSTAESAPVTGSAAKVTPVSGGSSGSAAKSTPEVSATSTGNAFKSTAGGASLTGSAPKVTPIAVESASAAKSTPEISATSTGNVPKATSISGESVSSDSKLEFGASFSKSEPQSDWRLLKSTETGSSESGSVSSAEALRAPNSKESSESSESSDDSESTSKPGNLTESVQGSSEESHMAQQVKPNVTTPRPVGISSNSSSVVMTIPPKTPSTLLPKYNSTSPGPVPSNFTKNNSSTVPSPTQGSQGAQGSAVQLACGGFALLAVSVHLVLSY